VTKLEKSRLSVKERVKTSLREDTLNTPLNKGEVLEQLRKAMQEVLPGAAPQSEERRIGYFCSYVPPEIILAAGFHPVRINGIGVTDSSTGDAYMSHLTCSYARHSVSALVDGHYDFLDGQIATNTCDHIRMANETIRSKSSLKYHGFITVPRNNRAEHEGFYREELERLLKSISEHFDRTVETDAVHEAISRMNRVRQRVKQIDRLRRCNPPLLSGTDAFTAFVAARLLLPERFIQLADRLIEAAEHGEPLPNVRARVILYGGELDDPRFIQVIESQGAHVVGDLLCFGARGLENEIETSDEPLKAIAKSYLHQISCARMIGLFPNRYEALKRLTVESNAHGIIFQRIKFCQIWGNEAFNLLHRFKSDPVPFLVIDREYGTVSTGQLRTRVQGFLERLGL
jgi:benzoyl-CoA reductase/2-hydroxyglutaryl-CoA dehydratase subunit BcrC/BadD/HgdB